MALVEHIRNNLDASDNLYKQKVAIMNKDVDQIEKLKYQFVQNLATELMQEDWAYIGILQAKI